MRRLTAVALLVGALLATASAAEQSPHQAEVAAKRIRELAERDL